MSRLRRSQRSLFRITGTAITSAVLRHATERTRLRYVPVAAGQEQTVLLASERQMKRIATACKVARGKVGTNKQPAAEREKG